MKDPRYSLSGHTPIDDAANTIRPYTYRYKAPQWEPRSQPDGKPYGGFMAQDMLRHPLTAQTIQQHNGALQVELKPLASLLGAIAGRHAERLNRHEAKLDEHAHMIERMHQILASKLGNK